MCKNSKNWLLSVFKIDAYKLGLKSNNKSKNPFKKSSNHWFSWNKGFNQK